MGRSPPDGCHIFAVSQIPNLVGDESKACADSCKATILEGHQGFWLVAGLLLVSQISRPFIGTAGL